MCLDCSDSVQLQRLFMLLDVLCRSLFNAVVQFSWLTSQNHKLSYHRCEAKTALIGRAIVGNASEQ